jgi:hypothetical protein
LTTSASRRFPRTRTWLSSSSAAPSPTSSSEKAGRIFRSTHEVCPQIRRQGHLGGDPQGRLWQPRVLSYAGQQGLSASFLLAHSFGRRRITCQKVPRVPVLRQVAARPSLQSSHHTANLAFRLLGAQHDWATANCARWIQQSIGGHRQVHQVNRGQAGHMPQGRQRTRLPG